MATDTHVDRIAAADEDETRTLHPLRLVAGPTGHGTGRGRHVGAAIDVETTGLDQSRGRIVELAIRRFRWDDDGIVTHLDEPYVWREDPGEPLSDEVRRLTGLTDADLAGCEIDEGTATRLLRSAHLVVAHNAMFDRRWVEGRLKEAKGLAWHCSMSQVDWSARGFDGRVLGYLLMQEGHYFQGHRASADVDAVIQLLRHRGPDGRTALAEMVERGGRPSWLVRARGADFRVKDRLADRGYRWVLGDEKVWWREVADDRLEEEQFWLARNVYDFALRPHALGPDVGRLTAKTRFL